MTMVSAVFKPVIQELLHITTQLEGKGKASIRNALPDIGSPFLYLPEDSIGPKSMQIEYSEFILHGYIQKE